MEKNIFEKQTPWQKDISRIKEQIGFKENKVFESKERKELIKQAVSKNIESGEFDFDNNFTEVNIPQDKQELLKYALKTAKSEGIVKAFKMVIKAKDPWLIDEFHDTLIEEIEKEIFHSENPA